MTTTSADRAPQATTARMPVRAPATQGPAGKSDRSAALSQVQRTAGNRGLAALLAQRRVALPPVRQGPRAEETDRAARTTSARDDRTAATGNRAVKRLLPPSPVTVQRKGPSLSGLKKAIGLGKKKSPTGPASAGSLRILPTAMGRTEAANEATTASSPGASSRSTRGGAPIPYGQGDEAGSGVGGHVPGEQANDAGSGSEMEGPEPSSESSASDAYSHGLKFAAAAAIGSANSESSDSSSESSETDDPYARGAAAMAAPQGPVASESSDSSSESSESDDPYARGAAAMAAAQGPVGSESSDSSSESSESENPYKGGAAAFAAAQGPVGSDSGESSESSESSSESESEAPATGQYRSQFDFPDDTSGSATSESSESSSESSEDFLPPPRAFGGQQGSESSDSASSSEDEPVKHWFVKERDRRYKDEFTQGSKDLPSVLDQGRSFVRDGRFASLDDFMKQEMGWSQSDCDKYLRKGSPNPIVAKVRRSGRAAFELHGGSTITQGSSKEPFDTSSMYSKFMGNGYSIYVMDKRGRLYAAQHKVGIFHHSSFLGGGDVAGAGEMEVRGGVLKTITNKSGHYLPTDDEMAQVMKELQSRGVDLSPVEYIPIRPGFMGGINAKQPYPGGAKAFLDDHG